MDETGFCGMNFFNTRQYCDSVRDVNFYLRKLHFLWIYHAEKFEACRSVRSAAKMGALHWIDDRVSNKRRLGKLNVPESAQNFARRDLRRMQRPT